MPATYYAANDGKAIIQIINVRGTNKIKISVGNSNLDWYQIDLNDEQTKRLRKDRRSKQTNVKEP